jgi:hypothetical protein
MGIEKLFARVRAAWINADERRRELERYIASYNTNLYCTRAHRQQLDRVLDDILGGPAPGATGRDAG